MSGGGGVKNRRGRPPGAPAPLAPEEASSALDSGGGGVNKARAGPAHAACGHAGQDGFEVQLRIPHIQGRHGDQRQKHHRRDDACGGTGVETSSPVFGKRRRGGGERRGGSLRKRVRRGMKRPDKTRAREVVLNGIAASPGIAIGRVYLFTKTIPAQPPPPPPPQSA